MKLSKLERGVVKSHKVWGFPAYLQGAWSDFPGLETDISERNYPTREHVTEVLDRMNIFAGEFDIEYNSLSRETANPLQVEQEAWKLLSPRVADYLTRFRQFTDSYQQEEVNEKSREQFLGLVKEGWDLLQKWNIISNSYKPKYEMSIYYNRTGWTEEELQQREKAVRELISDLSKP